MLTESKCCTVEPPLKDSPNKGHPLNKRRFPTFLNSEEDPYFKEQNGCFLFIVNSPIVAS